MTLECICELSEEQLLRKIRDGDVRVEPADAPVGVPQQAVSGMFRMWLHRTESKHGGLWLSQADVDDLRAEAAALGAD